MSLKNVKSESEWSGGTSAVLYEGHEIKQEIVLGPIVLQRCDLPHQVNGQCKLVTNNNKATIDASALGTDVMVRLVSEKIGSDYGVKKAHVNQADMSPTPASIKREPADDDLLLVADLGTDEMVRLGLTPETMGADYEIYRNKLTADIKKEATAPTSTAFAAPQSTVPASHVDVVVKDELLKEEASDRENGVYRRSRRLNKQKAETKQQFIKYSSNLTFETDSEDNDTDSEYEAKHSKHDTSDSDEKPNLNVKNRKTKDDKPKKTSYL
ncbi:uncharacterized protein LOC133532900 isoform X2 [Cydia pomonella]|uniref:uncharacterized protein LOC133532900 isoform X2 n=1 Tax=Cydia pomonella TaxID=82600 RepID=UPI002ADD3CBC|nr:uncharacterized protein LOC133532900 isoform X2 [Cydia pomonella]